MTDLPTPACEIGYTYEQLDEILGEVGTPRRDEFGRWMDGQTMGLCEGRAFDHDKREYYEVCDGVSHGPCVYPHDLRRFLAGLPVID